MRLPRVKVTDQAAFYHVYNRTTGGLQELPLGQPGARREFVRVLRHYIKHYFCQLAGYAVLDNHFHLKVRFQAYRRLSRKKLERLARKFYSGNYKPYRSWNNQQWARFNRRLFDISELMRNLEQVYSCRYNQEFERRGPLWVGRFKSTLYLGGEDYLESLFYVELNPFRAGLVHTPEQWKEGSAHLRYWGYDDWLLPLHELFPELEPEQVWAHYREQLLFRARPER